MTADELTVKINKLRMGARRARNEGYHGQAAMLESQMRVLEAEVVFPKCPAHGCYVHQCDCARQ